MAIVIESKMKPHMRSVYLLQHSYVAKHGAEEVKILGIFSTNRQALAALKRLENKTGFRDHKHGFHVDRYFLNAVFWEEGFSSSKNEPHKRTKAL